MKIFNIVRDNTDPRWEAITFVKNSPEPDDEFVESGVTMSFTNEVKTEFLLNEYSFANLIVSLSLKQLYGESQDSVALTFKIGDQEIETHGLLKNDESFFLAIFTDRSGTALKLSSGLPASFYTWLEDCSESLTW